jgi:pimeloyl-ACP methyl ester carboxylesterase
VAVLKSTATQPAADPVVFLNGGPGVHTLGLITSAFGPGFAAPVQGRRDMVFMDQRGTGLSDPALPRPEYVQSLGAVAPTVTEGIGERAGLPPHLVRLSEEVATSDLAVCADWGLPQPPDREHAAVASDLPALLMVGQYDATVPLAYSQLAAQSLPHANAGRVPGIRSCRALLSHCGSRRGRSDVRDAARRTVPG